MQFLKILLRYVDHLICALVNCLVFRMKRVDCRTNLRNINGIVSVMGNGRVIINTGVRINSGSRKNPIGGDARLILVCHDGGEILIGKNAGLSNCTIVSRSRVLIEENVRIGGGVKIYDTDFHNIDPQLRLMEISGSCQGLTKSIQIGCNAFIGAHSIILKGVTIGANSVVGAGSVITKDIPESEIWAGNPAVFVRKLSS